MSDCDTFGLSRCSRGEHDLHDIVVLYLLRDKRGRHDV